MTLTAGQAVRLLEAIKHIPRLLAGAAGALDRDAARGDIGRALEKH